MMITITSYHSTDDENINDLLFLCYGTDELSRSYFERGWKSSFNMGTFIAKNNLDLIGIVTAWKSSFHPHCLYFTLIVHPLYRGETVEHHLLASLENVSADLPLQTSIWETNFSLKNLFENYGFTEMRRTFMPTLNITLLKDIDLELIQKHQLNEIYIQSLSEIKNDHEMKKQLVTFAKETYEKTHKANPPREGDLMEWEKLIFYEDTLLEGSNILIKDNEIIGFAMLHIGEESDCLEFGWRGVKEEKYHNNLITLLTAFQIKYAKGHGYKYIKGEIDTTDPYSLEILKAFPFTPSPTWITYKKVR
ncbi:MAG: GNAT family N-acetyltransferase [Heyndrickxia sp.]